MNNFLTRLVTRNSMGFQNQKGVVSVVKPRIGSRFESNTGFSGRRAGQDNDFEDETFSSSDRQVPDNEMPVPDSRMQSASDAETGSRLEQQNKLAEVIGRHSEGDSSNDRSVPMNFGDEIKKVVPQQKQKDKSMDEMMLKDIPSVTITPDVFPPNFLPQPARENSEQTVLQDSGTRKIRYTENNKTDEIDAEQAVSESSLSDTRRTEHITELSQPIIQTKRIETHVNSIPIGLNETSSRLPLSSPILSNDSKPVRIEPTSESIVSDLQGHHAQITEQDIPATQLPRRKSEMPTTSIISTRSTLSGEPRGSSSGLVESDKLDSPILYGTASGKSSANRMDSYSFPVLSAPSQVEQTAQPPVVKVSIGRIEIRATTPVPQAITVTQRPRRGPAVSLSDYLNGKGGNK